VRVKSRIYRLEKQRRRPEYTYTRVRRTYFHLHTHTYTHIYTYTQASTATGYSTDVIAFSYFGDGAPIERSRSGDNPQTHARTFT